jgi:branched-chain amino acid transport system permease protein
VYRRRWILWLVILAIACLPPFFVNDYLQYIFNTILVYAVVSIGFNIVLGYAGQLAFANAAFFGVGAYATAIAMGRWGWPLLLALPFAALVTALVGLLVSLPALRLRAYYLAIVTLAFGELLRWSYIHADWLTLGSSGLPVPTASLFGFSLASERSRYWLFLSLTVLVLWGSANLLRSRFGRAIVAVRDNEAAASAMGIAPALTKIGAFAWSGCVVGIGGGMFALLLGRINPESFDLSQLLLHFTLVMIGGLGSLVGSVAGAILLTAAPEVLRNVAGLEEIVFSLLLIGVLLFMPKGLAGLLSRSRLLREQLYLD